MFLSKKSTCGKPLRAFHVLPDREFKSISQPETGFFQQASYLTRGMEVHGYRCACDGLFRTNDNPDIFSRLPITGHKDENTPDSQDPDYFPKYQVRVLNRNTPVETAWSQDASPNGYRLTHGQVMADEPCRRSLVQADLQHFLRNIHTNNVQTGLVE